MSYEIRRSLGDFWATSVANIPVAAGAFTTINTGVNKVVDNPLSKVIAPLFWIELNVGVNGVILPAGTIIAMQAFARVNSGTWVKCFNFQRGVNWIVNDVAMVYGTMVTLDFLSPGTVIPANGSITIQVRADFFTTVGLTVTNSNTVGAYGI